MSDRERGRGRKSEQTQETCKVSAMCRHRQERDLRAHDEAENKGLQTRIRMWDNMRYMSQRHSRCKSTLTPQAQDSHAFIDIRKRLQICVLPLPRGSQPELCKGFSLHFLLSVSQNHHHGGAVSGRAEDIQKDVCCGSTTRSMTLTIFCML